MRIAGSPVNPRHPSPVSRVPSPGSIPSPSPSYPPYRPPAQRGGRSGLATSGAQQMRYIKDGDRGRARLPAVRARVRVRSPVCARWAQTAAPWTSDKLSDCLVFHMSIMLRNRREREKKFIGERRCFAGWIEATCWRLSSVASIRLAFQASELKEVNIRMQLVRLCSLQIQPITIVFCNNWVSGHCSTVKGSLCNRLFSPC